MRPFVEQPSGVTVDLDDPQIYDYIGTDDVDKLNDIMLRHIGYAICYMDYWNKDIFATEPSEPIMEEYNGRMIDINITNVGYKQRLRVNDLIKIFTENRRDNFNNALWFKEQIFRFQNEIENMC